MNHYLVINQKTLHDACSHQDDSRILGLVVSCKLSRHDFNISRDNSKVCQSDGKVFAKAPSKDS